MEDIAASIPRCVRYTALPKPARFGCTATILHSDKGWLIGLYNSYTALCSRRLDVTAECLASQLSMDEDGDTNCSRAPRTLK
jgi:hypothetical protein